MTITDKKVFIKNIILPNLSTHNKEIVRIHNTKAVSILSESKIIFEFGGHVTFDTVLNDIDISKLREKNIITSMHMAIKGHGKFIVRIGLHRAGHAQKWLEEQIVNLDNNNREDYVTIEIKSWKYCDTGMMYLSLDALNSACLESCYFYSDSK
jgi:hypothetical protein